MWSFSPFNERLIMSSVWLVLSSFGVPAEGEGFHVTEEAAIARAQEKVREDRAAYDAVKRWLEIPFDEFRAIRRMPSTYGVVKVEDVEYEIQRGGNVPDVVWVLVEDDEVDPEFGFRATREGAEGLLLQREIAQYEAWEHSVEREGGESFPEYFLGRSCFGTLRIERHGDRGAVERSTPQALEIKDQVLEGSQALEPTMTVREGLTTFTWETPDGRLVEVRVAETGTVAATIHQDAARPLAVDGREEVVMRARQALGALPHGRLGADTCDGSAGDDMGS